MILHWYMAILVAAHQIRAAFLLYDWPEMMSTYFGSFRQKVLENFRNMGMKGLEFFIFIFGEINQITGGHTKMIKIFINPGHAPKGEPDAGACNSKTGLRECDVVASIGALVASYLEKVGYEVQVLQDDSLSSICSAANDWAADLFVSIHCNSDKNELVKGSETYKYYGSIEGDKLANCVQNQLVKSLPVVDRGVKEAGFYVIKNTNMTACLVETAFISNADDEKLLADPERQDRIAGAIARGITDYFALT